MNKREMFGRCEMHGKPYESGGKCPECPRTVALNVGGTAPEPSHAERQPGDAMADLGEEFVRRVWMYAYDMTSPPSDDALRRGRELAVELFAPPFRDTGVPLGNPNPIIYAVNRLRGMAEYGNDEELNEEDRANARQAEAAEADWQASASQLAALREVVTTVLRHLAQLDVADPAAEASVGVIERLLETALASGGAGASEPLTCAHTGHACAFLDAEPGDDLIDVLQRDYRECCAAIGVLEMNVRHARAAQVRAESELAMQRARGTEGAT